MGGAGIERSASRRIGRTKFEPGYVPRRFNAESRYRFLKTRREDHLARVPGEATTAQQQMARSMAVLEWGALQCEHDGSVVSLREAREHRRLLLRVLGDFERSLEPKPPARRPSRSLGDIVAGVGE